MKVEMGCGEVGGRAEEKVDQINWRQRARLAQTETHSSRLRCKRADEERGEINRKAIDKVKVNKSREPTIRCLF